MLSYHYPNDFAMYPKCKIKAMMIRHMGRHNFMRRHNFVAIFPPLLLEKPRAYPCSCIFP